MLAAHRMYVVLGIAVAVVTCTQAGIRGIDEYRGATLERVEELPTIAAVGGAPGVAWTGPMSSSGSDPFESVCATKLRIAKDGRELLLKRSQTATRETREDNVATTTLVSAVGEYLLLTPEALKGGTAPRLRVDCVKGRATAWVGE